MTNNQVQGSRAKPIIAEAWQPIESAEEWELEGLAFAAANDECVPDWARETVKRLWFAFVMREKWHAQGMSPGTAETGTGSGPQDGQPGPKDAPDWKFIRNELHQDRQGI